MPKKLCPVCRSETRKIKQVFQSKKLDAQTGAPITIDTFVLACEAADCKFQWLPLAEEHRLDEIVLRRSRVRLSSGQIKSLREAMGFASKKEAADILGLNAKAFTHWEQHSSDLSPAMDNYLRLVAHNPRNLDFLRDLKAKQYRFDSRDYAILCDSSSQWNYSIVARERILLSANRFKSFSNSDYSAFTEQQNSQVQHHAQARQGGYTSMQISDWETNLNG